ncbi:amidohydrolase family protein [Marivibrio halodurans]|uniref:Amidohydrolase family protein n=1 Tax=Marivibrio halodurans TaxID=2039722 RepID=A0A8J7V2L7_9PROT|nr:amidohydrolase family protein [Marivibrio halodurans]
MIDGHVILHGGVIRTLDESGPDVVSAMEVRDGRILSLGPLDSLPGAYDPRVARVDLQGRCVTPGLTDGHAHMDREGLKAAMPSLHGATSIVEVQHRVAAAARGAAPGAWVVMGPLGAGPAYAGDPAKGLAEGRLPTRDDLDAACPDTAVYIRAPWGYWRPAGDGTPLISIANSAALRAMGLADSVRDLPAGVALECDARGRPTGVFKEPGPVSAVEMTLLPGASRFTAGQRADALGPSMRAYLRGGATAVFEGHGASPELLALYRDAREAERLDLRVRLAVGPAWGDTPPGDIGAAMDAWYSWARGRGLGDDMMRAAGFYAQAGKPSPDLCRQCGYTGWAGYTFESTMPRSLFREFVLEGARQGFRLCTLFAEDLDLFREADHIRPIGDLRWVVGHVGILDREKIAKMRDLGIVATLHTNRSIADIGPREAARLGVDEAWRIAPARALMEAGVPFALSSDNHPVGLFGPFAHCVTRKAHPEAETIAADQALSREEALRAAAVGGAFLTFDEARRGRLKPGAWADMVVLSDDPIRCEEAALWDIRAEAALVGGRVVLDEGGLFSPTLTGSDARSEGAPASNHPSEAVFLHYDQAGLDRAYDQMAWAGNAKDIIRWYDEATRAARESERVTLDLAYGGDPLERLDVYSGRGDAPLKPAVIYIHGGAWKLLSKDESGWMAPAFADLGISTVAVNFGRRPDSTLPRMIERVREACLWVRDNAAELGLDPDRLMLVGHSSGAHVAGAALTADWRATYGRDAPVAGALLASGGYDLTPVMLSARGRYLDLGPADIDACGAATGAERIRCPVRLAVGTEESPEFLRQTQAYHAALRARGVAASLVHGAGLNHFEISQTLAEPGGLLLEEIRLLFEGSSLGK